MRTKIRCWIIGTTLAAGIGLVYWCGPVQAGDPKDLPSVVKDIAKSLKAGNLDAAKKVAAATVENRKLIDETSDLMHIFRPTDKGGLGIEKELKKPNVKDAERLGNLSAAMAELILAKGWPKDQGKRTKKGWNEYAETMRAASLDLAKANNAQKVTAAATKINNSCVGCHAIYKD